MAFGKDRIVPDNENCMIPTMTARITEVISDLPTKAEIKEGNKKCDAKKNQEHCNPNFPTVGTKKYDQHLEIPCQRTY